MKTFCSYFNQGICSSCDLITEEYAEQVRRKEQELQDFQLLPTISSSPSGFRNKAKLVVTGTIDQPILGLWGTENLDEGRELLSCPLHTPEINRLLPSLKEFIKLARLTPYQIASKMGELKGIIIFHSQTTHETYLRFILRSKESLDRLRKNLPVLQNQFPNLQCVSANIQPIAHAILEGDEEIILSKKSSIQHKLGDVTFSLGPRAFVQTNQEVAQKLYETAALWVKESGFKNFMELFCGQGAFSFFCAPWITEGLGIEINPDAIKEANLTAEKHQLHHLKFKAADASKVSLELAEFNPEIILVNPPRRGLSEATDLILNHMPKMIIYSSCNAQTLKSDLKKLSNKYEMSRIQIFDMFPHTKHFEVLVELRLIKPVH